jgi:hypothetical protein
MALQQTQRNQVLSEIASAGLDPADFEWIPSHRYLGTEAALRHRPTRSEFHFIFDDGDWVAFYTPAQGKPDALVKVLDWTGEMLQLGWWLGVVKAESISASARSRTYARCPFPYAARLNGRWGGAY